MRLKKTRKRAEAREKRKEQEKKKDRAREKKMKKTGGVWSRNETSAPERTLIGWSTKAWILGQARGSCNWHSEWGWAHCDTSDGV